MTSRSPRPLSVRLPWRGLVALVALGLPALGLLLAQTVPTDIEQPGTQPLEVPSLEPPTKCDNCHGGYDAAVEPTFNWQGGMMAQASRDPIFWATVAVAEQDFDGSGDLCLRCHIYDGWVGGRSEPTDGSAMLQQDAGGVSCDLCHALTNPDGSELTGVQLPPYLAHDEGQPAVGYYGSGMGVLSVNNAKIGPYADPASPHGFQQSAFHRSEDFCGTCHDVSNPAVGDLAHNHGAMTPLSPGSFSGVPGAPVDGKAAFNNFPYQYGIVERTYSEHKASLAPQTLVSDYLNLPTELQAGAFEDAYLAATAASPDGNYLDGTPRTFTCQSCHMPPKEGKGCNKNNAPVRADLPLHDQTGGNYWMGDVLQYMDAQGELVLGGGLSSGEIAALDAGKARAEHNLTRSASLSVQGDELKVVNLTGHKLISGYPEGRRMWLNVKWRDAGGALLREDGAYGPLSVTLGGAPAQVETLLDLHDPHARVYEAHYGMTSEWAQQLLTLGYPSDLALSYDRVSEAVVRTLGELAAQPPGTSFETFRFVLNNTVVKDNRIPPYGLDHDQAVARNVLPVPADQYGNPGAGGAYEHYDEVELDPPIGAATAEIALLYQSTSWEYVQFLYLANDGTSAFLGQTGDDLLDAWLNTEMASPRVMATALWSAAGCPSPEIYCTAKVSSQGCTPAIGHAGEPSLTAPGPFDVTADQVLNNKNGILFYGLSGRYALPFQGGILCVKPPTRRTGVQSSGGNPPPADCSGTFAFDFNAWMQGGQDPNLILGVQVNGQYWYRDPQSPSTTGLTDGIEFSVCP